jgi:hypothetical protein
VKSEKRIVKSDKENGGDMTKYAYFFGDGKADGRADMKNLLGGC